MMPLRVRDHGPRMYRHEDGSLSTTAPPPNPLAVVRFAVQCFDGSNRMLCCLGCLLKLCGWGQSQPLSNGCGRQACDVYLGIAVVSHGATWGLTKRNHGCCLHGWAMQANRKLWRPLVEWCSLQDSGTEAERTRKKDAG